MKTGKIPKGLKAIPKEITFAEYEAVREAINNNDFPAFQKASIDIYFKISAIHHDAYLKFRGINNKETEPEYEIENSKDGDIMKTIYARAQDSIAELVWYLVELGFISEDNQKDIKTAGANIIYKHFAAYKINRQEDTTERYVANKEEEKPMTRHIKVRVLESSMGIWVQIIEQTHRGFDFSPSSGGGRDDSFMSGYDYLKSQNYPRCSKWNFFVRGNDSNEDFKKMKFPNRERLKQFLTAIKEYNEYWAAKDAINEDKDVCPPETLETKCYEVG